MKFGVSLVGISPRYYLQVAPAAEAHGFESLWISEHLLFPADLPAKYPYTEDGVPHMGISADTPLYDAWPVLGYLAAATSTIRLGTDVFILPLRHPLATARSIVTLDRLSGGRVILGVGVGWLEDEFTAVGESFGNRGKRTDEIVPLLRRLWTDDVIEHHGTYYDFAPIKFQPKPVQKPCPPIEIGGATPPALRRAGRLGDGWVEIGASSFEQLEEMLAVVFSAREEAGRAGEPFEVTLTSPLTSDLDSVRRAADAGVTRIVTTGPPFTGARITAEDFIDWLAQYQDEIIAKF